MKHKAVKKKLIRYLDGDLPEDEQLLVREHLSSCSECRSRLNRLQEFWKTDRPVPRLTAPPYLWNRVSEGLREGEEEAGVAGVLARLFPYLRPVAAMVLILVTILAGILMGEYFMADRSQMSAQGIQYSTVEEELGMEYFSLNPPGSMVTTLLIEEEGENLR